MIEATLAIIASVSALVVVIFDKIKNSNITHSECCCFQLDRNID